MVLTCTPVYHGKSDILQVAAFISEDDGSPIERLVKSGTVRVLHNNETIHEVDFDQRAYSKGSGEEGNEGFYFFFLHPPLRQNLRAVVSIEMLDDRTAKTIEPIQRDSVLNSRGEESFSNPSLANRPVIDHSGRNIEIL
jgi:hypothetical protein